MQNVIVKLKRMIGIKQTTSLLQGTIPMPEDIKTDMQQHLEKVYYDKISPKYTGKPFMESLIGVIIEIIEEAMKEKEPKSLKIPAKQVFEQKKFSNKPMSNKPQGGKPRGRG